MKYKKKIKFIFCPINIKSLFSKFKQKRIWKNGYTESRPEQGRELGTWKLASMAAPSNGESQFIFFILLLQSHLLYRFRYTPRAAQEWYCNLPTSPSSCRPVSSGPACTCPASILRPNWLLPVSFLAFFSKRLEIYSRVVEKSIVGVVLLIMVIVFVGEGRRRRWRRSSITRFKRLRAMGVVCFVHWWEFFFF